MGAANGPWLPLREWVQVQWNRLRLKLRRRVVERELAEEMQFHRDLLVRDALEEGNAPAEAVAAARRRFGSEWYFLEQSRDVWGMRWLDEAAQDFRSAIWSARRNPVLSGAIVLTLSLAIGANTAIFSLLAALLLDPLPVMEEARLVKLERTDLSGGRTCCFPPRLIRQLAEGRASIADLGAYDLTRLNVRMGEHAEPADGALVSGGLFELLGVRAFLGRLLVADDDVRGGDAVTVISYGHWSRRFGADRTAIGRVVDLNGMAVTIVGVLPREFTLELGIAPPEYWLPMSLHPALGLNDHTEFHVYAQLAGSATVAAAEAELSAAYAAFTLDSMRRNVAASAGSRTALQAGGGKFAQRPRAAASGDAAPRLEVIVLRPREFAAGLGMEVGEQLRILLIAGLIVLFVVSANIANLMFARGAAREREMALRQAIGAGRGRLLRLMLVESLVLAVAGAALGILLARWSGNALLRFLAPEYAAILVDLRPDLRLIAFVAGLAGVATAVFGLPPAIRATSVDLHGTLKASWAGSGSSRAVLRTGRVLVSGQVALSLLLLVAAAVLVRSVQNLGSRDPGYERAQVLTFGTHATTLGYEGERELALYEQLRNRIEEIPGVSAASYHRYAIAQLPVRPCAREDDGPDIRSTVPVGPAFFETLRIPVLAGRSFNHTDGPGAPPVVVLGESLAREIRPAGNALGTALRIRTPEGYSTAQIIGIVRDTGYRDAAAPAPCQVYSPVAQAPARRRGQMIFVVRSERPTASINAALLSAIGEVEPNLAVRDLQTLESLARAGFREVTAFATLTSAFSGLTLVFVAIGLFGILSYSVATRRHELALRVALGARQQSVVMKHVLEMLRVVLFGTVIGVVAAVSLVRLAGAFLYGIEPTDPLSIAAAMAMVVLIGFVAVILPARRAARVDPCIVLRMD